jgi:hypothetical protein
VRSDFSKSLQPSVSERLLSERRTLPTASASGFSLRCLPAVAGGRPERTEAAVGFSEDAVLVTRSMRVRAAARRFIATGEPQGVARDVVDDAVAEGGQLRFSHNGR